MIKQIIVSLCCVAAGLAMTLDIHAQKTTSGS